MDGKLEAGFEAHDIHIGNGLGGGREDLGGFHLPHGEG
jgi:hypothetical protein